MAMEENKTMTTAPASDKHYTARMIERKDLSEDLWLIRVDPGGPFQFKAGQYATLGVDYGEKRIERAYSIVSSPYEQALEFFVELVPQGELTPHLYCCDVPWFKFVTTISRPWEDAAWKSETGRVDDLVRKYCDLWGLRPDTTTAYLCGHPSMCENGQAILKRAGWQKGSMFEEV
jgi:ferredoxin-NADP reductase